MELTFRWLMVLITLVWVGISIHLGSIVPLIIGTGFSALVLLLLFHVGEFFWILWKQYFKPRWRNW